MARKRMASIDSFIRMLDHQEAELLVVGVASLEKVCLSLGVVFEISNAQAKPTVFLSSWCLQIQM